MFSQQPPLTFQLISDLHLEHERAVEGQSTLYTYEFPVESDVLALPGDTGEALDERLFDWLRVQLTRFKLVLFLPGNHEPNRMTLSACQDRFASFATESDARAHADPSSSFGRFVFLNRTRHDLSSTVTVLGCTLWARLEPPALAAGLADFKRIAEFDADAYLGAHAADLAFLRDTITAIARDEPQRTIIVVTHHAPTVEGTSDPQYAGGPTASAFATEILEELAACGAGQVKAWMFGHTHWSCDFERAGVRVVSNQRGYRGGDGRFDPRKVIEI